MVTILAIRVALPIFQPAVRHKERERERENLARSGRLDSSSLPPRCCGSQRAPTCHDNWLQIYYPCDPVPWRSRGPRLSTVPMGHGRSAIKVASHALSELESLSLPHAKLPPWALCYNNNNCTWFTTRIYVAVSYVSLSSSNRVQLVYRNEINSNT